MPEALAFDPLNGGCPHCKWLDINLGHTRDEKCYPHLMIEDMQVDRDPDRRIARDKAPDIENYLRDMARLKPNQ